MDNCAYCGENVGTDALYVDEDVFCSEECMRDFSARDYGGDDDDYDEDDYDDEDEEDEDEEEELEEDDDY